MDTPLVKTVLNLMNIVDSWTWALLNSLSTSLGLNLPTNSMDVIGSGTNAKDKVRCTLPWYRMLLVSDFSDDSLVMSKGLPPSNSRNFPSLESNPNEYNVKDDGDEKRPQDKEDIKVQPIIHTQTDSIKIEKPTVTITVTKSVPSECCKLKTKSKKRNCTFSTMQSTESQFLSSNVKSNRTAATSVKHHHNQSLQSIISNPVTDSISPHLFVICWFFILCIAFKLPLPRLSFAIISSFWITLPSLLLLITANTTYSSSFDNIYISSLIASLITPTVLFFVVIGMKIRKYNEKCYNNNNKKINSNTNLFLKPSVFFSCLVTTIAAPTIVSSFLNIIVAPQACFVLPILLNYFKNNDSDNYLEKSLYQDILLAISVSLVNFNYDIHLQIQELSYLNPTILSIVFFIVLCIIRFIRRESHLDHASFVYLFFLNLILKGIF